MTVISRRRFAQDSLATLLTMSLLEDGVPARNSWGRCAAGRRAQWLRDIEQMGEDLKGQKLEQLVWQQKVEELFKQVPLADILALIDFDQLSSGVKFVDNGALSMRFKFPEVEGVPKNFIYGRQIFALKKDRSVVPHGHNNMATAFLVLKGDLHGRHYDRLKDEPEHYIIKPTVDRTFTPGECSTVSDFKDNIHWFKAISEPAFIFNLHVLSVNPNNREPTGRLYLDPEGEKLADGLIRARQLSYDEAHKLYG